MTVHGKLELFAPEIRARYAAGNVSQEELAFEYGCSQNAISHVVRGTVYQDRHVERYRVESRCEECGTIWSWWRYPSRRQSVFKRCAECAEKTWRRVGNVR